MAAYSYIVLEEAANLAVSLTTVKTWLKLDTANSPSDPELTLLIRAATEYAEAFTKRTFINTKFRTYRDFFQCCIELRRSKLREINSYQYSKDDTFIDVDSSLYYSTDEKDFSRIMLKEDKSYPTDIDNRLQAVRIDFTAGYGLNETDIPDSLRVALLKHIGAYNENAGDCDDDLVKSGANFLMTTAVPAASLDIYKKYRIADIENECY